jgi:hypothetical protein
MPSTLAQMITLVETELRDPSNLNWSEAEITMHLRRAMRAVNEVSPQFLDYELHTTKDTLEYALSGIAGFLEVVDVWYPYDSSDKTADPRRPRWRIVSGTTLRLEEVEAPQGDDSDNCRVFYTAPHTISGLDGAATSTMEPAQEQGAMLGAVGYALAQQAAALANSITAHPAVAREYSRLAASMGAAFTALLEHMRRRKVYMVDARTQWG